MSGLTNGTAYTFVVRAANNDGFGLPSAPSAPVVPAATVPGAPTGVSATGGNTNATVSWVAPVADGGTPITGYVITAQPGGATVNTEQARHSVVVGSLVNGTAYTFTVKAVNAVGQSQASAASAAATPSTVPSAPQNVAGVVGNSTIALTWAAPASNGGAPLTGYTVTVTPGATSQSVDATTTSVQITGLTNGTAYTVAVTAANARGTGPAATTAPLTPVGAVTNPLSTPPTSVVVLGSTIEIIPTPAPETRLLTALGYRMFSSDGAVFTFGDVRFFGSMGGKKPTVPSSPCRQHHRAMGTGS